MAKISIETINKLREATGAPIVRVKKVLEEFDGDEKKSLEVLMKEGFEKVAKREERETAQGIVFTYSHHTQKLASMVEILCETDFVARNELFVKLGADVSLQIASMNPQSLDELLESEFIKDTSKTISHLVKEVIAKTGENVRIGRFYRLELGK